MRSFPTTHSSEIIELKFGKKLPYILCILTLLQNYGCLIISEKMPGYQHFSFWIPITLGKVYFFPIVKAFAKIHLYLEAPSLNEVKIAHQVVVVVFVVVVFQIRSFIDWW